MAKKGAKRDGSKTEAVREYFKKDPKASPKAVKADLDARGIEVSLALVNKVKYEKSSGKGRKKVTTRRGGGRKAATGGATMSDKIRAYMAANPGATRPEIREGLKKQGVDVKNSLVNAVFIKARKSGGPKAKPGRRRGRKPAAASASTLSAAELVNAKQLIDQIGGADKVREALELLEQLQ